MRKALLKNAFLAQNGGSLPAKHWGTLTRNLPQRGMITLENEMNSTSHLPDERAPWCAVRTKSNCESVVATALAHKGYEQYLPIHRCRRRLHGRVIEAELPLFRGYVFCRFDANIPARIVTTPGVLSIVSCGSEPAPIPESEIEAVRAILRSGQALEPWAFVQEGERIRVTRGALEGLEGILLKKRNEWRMVISVIMLQRSISVEIDRECVMRTN